MSRGSSVGIATCDGLDDRGVGLRVPVGSRLSRLHIVQTGSGVRPVFPRGLSGRGVKLTTHLQLVRSSRKRGSIHPLPHTPSRRRARLIKYRDNVTIFLRRNFRKTRAKMNNIGMGLNVGTEVSCRSCELTLNTISESMSLLPTCLWPCGNASLIDPPLSGLFIALTLQQGGYYELLSCGMQHFQAGVAGTTSPVESLSCSSL
jgi:hypothetical protein